MAKMPAAIQGHQHTIKTQKFSHWRTSPPAKTQGTMAVSTRFYSMCVLLVALFISFQGKALLFIKYFIECVCLCFFRFFFCFLFFVFLSHKNFFNYMKTLVILVTVANFALTRHSLPLSSKGSLACHT